MELSAISMGLQGTLALAEYSQKVLRDLLAFRRKAENAQASLGSVAQDLKLISDLLESIEEQTRKLGFDPCLLKHPATAGVLRNVNDASRDFAELVKRMHYDQSNSLGASGVSQQRKLRRQLEWDSTSG